jgi:hypothetical protein
MAHHHGQSHLVRRQRNRDDDDDTVQAIETIVSVRVVTAQNTYTGKVVWVTQEAPKTLIAPAERPMPATTNAEDAQQTSKPVSSSKKTSAISSSTKNTDNDHRQTSATPSSQTTLMVATKAPTPSAPIAIAGLASASATISAAASAETAPAGMSGGAKAGLALGILVGIGALLVGILLVYRRKKKQIAATNKDNEKTELHQAPAAPPHQTYPVLAPVPQRAPSIRSERNLSAAPQLSLRPVTQFDPAFDNNKNAAGLLGAAPATPSKELPDRPRSAWERPGAANVPAENPFNDPHQSGPPSANPFGNNAAVDATQSKIPDSLLNDSPLHSTKPCADFANPVAAIASANVDRIAAATTMASIPPPSQQLPAPPAINAASNSVPPSPAWTEDFPASPGPAPTGPPPVAGAIVGAAANGPAPVNNVHRVQLDFKPSMQDELGLGAGQLVRMLHEYDDGWVCFLQLHTTLLTNIIPRLFVFAWTVPNKVSSPAHVSPSTRSSLAPVHPVKAHHPLACADPPSAHQQAPAAFLRPAHSLPAAAPTLHPSLALVKLPKCKPLPVAAPAATLLSTALPAAAQTATHHTPSLSAQCRPAPTAVDLKWHHRPKWAVPDPTPRTRLVTRDADLPPDRAP